MEVNTQTLQLHRGQSRFLRLTEEHRVCALLARRQYGKTTVFSAIALRKMMKQRNHTVIFGSAKLNLSREIVRKEAEVIQNGIRSFQTGDLEKRLRFANDRTGKLLPAELSADDFADTFEQQRLEFRYYHSAASYSRTKVVALRADTVGETGDLMTDETGRVPNWLEVCEAIEPIISRNRHFRWTMATTPPPDDTHFSFAQLTPPIGLDFPVKPDGNVYVSDLGITVLRVDAFDAYADGVPMYDLEKGEPLSPGDHRAKAYDKDAWDRNYGCKFVIGGTSACGLLELDSAQRRGVGQCAFVFVHDDLDFDCALRFLADHLGRGPVGCGWDLASTEKNSSNPSGFTLTEGIGLDHVQRLVVCWKTGDPRLQVERARRLLEVVAARKEGGRAKKLSIDATGDRLFARSAQDALQSLCPVELVVMSETVRLPGYDSSITRKTHLADRYVGLLGDNRLWLPPERYIRVDHRLPKKMKGIYVCDPDPEGRHGDTFTSGKLASWSLTAETGIGAMVG